MHLQAGSILKIQKQAVDLCDQPPVFAFNEAFSTAQSTTNFSRFTKSHSVSPKPLQAV